MARTLLTLRIAGSNQYVKLLRDNVAEADKWFNAEAKGLLKNHKEEDTAKAEKFSKGAALLDRDMRDANQTDLKAFK